MALAQNRKTKFIEKKLWKVNCTNLPFFPLKFEGFENPFARKMIGSNKSLTFKIFPFSSKESKFELRLSSVSEFILSRGETCPEELHNQEKVPIF